MPDPRNVAHDKTVAHNKEHAGKAIVPDAAEKPQPGKKPALKHHAKDEKLPETGEAAAAVNPNAKTKG